jgi:glutathione S-transferase
MERIEARLKGLSDSLGDKEWLQDRFTIGDLMMVTALRQLRNDDVLTQFPNISAYVKRGEERPAFQKALSDQLAVFREHEPQPQGEAA